RPAAPALGLARPGLLGVPALELRVHADRALLRDPGRAPVSTAGRSAPHGLDPRRLALPAPRPHADADRGAAPRLPGDAGGDGGLGDPDRGRHRSLRAA